MRNVGWMVAADTSLIKGNMSNVKPIGISICQQLGLCDKKASILDEGAS